MTDYDIRLDAPVSEKIMQDLKLEQGFTNFGLKLEWNGSTVRLTNVSEYKEIPGISRAFDANAKFILAFLCEMHSSNGKLYRGSNVIDAYYGKDEPSLADEIWNSLKRWVAIAFK